MNKTHVEYFLGACIVIALLTIAFSSCSDDNDDSDTELREVEVAQPLPNTCAHDGDIWICDEYNSCVRDESSVIDDTDIVDDMARMNYFVRDLTTGNITIISECGSNVTFNITSNDDEQATE